MVLSLNDRVRGEHGTYRIISPVGREGFASVYLASTEQGLPVAVKDVRLHDLDDDQRELALATYHREVQALSILSHPGIPRLFDAALTEDHGYLVMEFIRGDTLK